MREEMKVKTDDSWTDYRLTRKVDGDTMTTVFQCQNNCLTEHIVNILCNVVCTFKRDIFSFNMYDMFQGTGNYLI